MNKKHQKTLEVIFSQPTPSNLEWRRIEALFVASGAKVSREMAHEYPLSSMMKKVTFTGLTLVKRQNDIR